MISSVAKVKLIKTKAIFRYDTKVVSNQVSSNSHHEIKSYSYSNSSTKIAKIEKWEKFFWVTKRGNKRITNRGKRDYKQGQFKVFQIGTKRLQTGAGISNRDKEISNWGQRLQIGQEGFQVVAGLQIGAEQFSYFLSYIFALDLEEENTGSSFKAFLVVFIQSRYNVKINDNSSFGVLLQKQPPEGFYKKGVLKNFAKFTAKHLR